MANAGYDPAALKLFLPHSREGGAGCPATQERGSGENKGLLCPFQAAFVPVYQSANI